MPVKQQGMQGHSPNQGSGASLAPLRFRCPTARLARGRAGFPLLSSFVRFALCVQRRMSLPCPVLYPHQGTPAAEPWLRPCEACFHCRAPARTPHWFRSGADRFSDRLGATAWAILISRCGRATRTSQLALGQASSGRSWLGWELTTPQSINSTHPWGGGHLLPSKVFGNVGLGNSSECQ